jgi:flagellar biosynthesis component FlhA
MSDERSGAAPRKNFGNTTKAAVVAAVIMIIPLPTLLLVIATGVIVTRPVFNGSLGKDAGTAEPGHHRRSL